VVSIDRGGDDDDPIRDAGAMASCGFPPLLSRNLGGRPAIDADLRVLIRRINIENALWGAPRIRGELLKLGIAVAQSIVAKYIVGTDCRPSGQTWGTFLRDVLPFSSPVVHAPEYGRTVLMSLRMANRWTWIV
jgi:hypothetical protein